MSTGFCIDTSSKIGHYSAADDIVVVKVKTEEHCMQTNKVSKLKIVSKITAPEGQPLKLDIGCGANKQPDHVGIDMFECSADHVMDVRKTPWPIDDGAVDSIHTSHFVEHLDGPERITFMEECWRVLRDGGQLVVICPLPEFHARAYGDPSHKWPPQSVNGHSCISTRAGAGQTS